MPEKDSLDKFQAKLKKAYKTEMVFKASEPVYTKYKRFSSGIVSLDVALGGGFPFGKFVLIYGWESTGKSLIALKAGASITNYCSGCHQHSLECSCEKFSPCRALYVDPEGGFDLAWALQHGFDAEWNCLARPDTAEQVFDIIEEAVRDEVFDLIILDSIAACTPLAEIDSSNEDAQVGVTARIVNKSYRKINQAVAKSKKQPCVMYTNQIRDKIGVSFGNPEAIPHGHSQRFFPAIRVRTKSPRVHSKGKVTSSVDMGGKVNKNKTFLPHLSFAYQLGLRDTEELKFGEIDNAEQLIRLADSYGLVHQDKGWYLEVAGTPSIKTKLKSELSKEVSEDKSFFYACWKEVLKVACEQMYKNPTALLRKEDGLVVSDLDDEIDT